MSQIYDIVVFGATAYTGQYVIEALANVAEDENLKWAVAGRNAAKIDSVMQSVAKYIKVENWDYKSVPVILADVGDEQSIVNMVQQAKLVINIVGPYDWYGEVVVKSCVLHGTHYLDISGEPQFLELMQLNYYDDAEKNEVYVIGACGFDSIPSEMGIQFLKSKCEGDVSSIDMYLKTKSTRGGKINAGTWKSAVNGVSKMKKLGAIRRALFARRLPKPEHPNPRKAFKRSPLTETYVVAFPASDRSIAMRTIQFEWNQKKERPYQFESYISVGGFMSVIGLMIFGAFFLVMTKFRLTRRLLINNPALFTFGVCSETGMTREQIEGVTFEEIFEAKYYDKQLPLDEKHQEPPTKRKVAKISGPEPGYLSCGRMVVQAAICVLKEADKIPGKGGVLTPGYAFRGTTLIERIEKQGIKFDVVE